MEKSVKTILKVMELMRENKEDEAKDLICSLELGEVAQCLGILMIVKDIIDQL